MNRNESNSGLKNFVFIISIYTPDFKLQVLLPGHKLLVSAKISLSYSVHAVARAEIGSTHSTDKKCVLREDKNAAKSTEPIH